MSASTLFKNAAPALETSTKTTFSRVVASRVDSGDPASSPPELKLSPLDRMNAGRAVPMVWFYEASLDPEALLAALERTLASYPLFSGRYAASEKSFEAVCLTNQGVPVEVCSVQPPERTLQEAIAHLPLATPTFFERNRHEPFVPPKMGMDPDRGSPDAPLLAIKISVFPAGGTAIGILSQHGVADGDADVTFMRNWSRAYRGLELECEPVCDRGCVHAMIIEPADAGAEAAAAAAAAAAASSSAAAADAGTEGGDMERPEGNEKLRVIEAGQQWMPEFVPVMPKIGGDHVCCVPFTASALRDLKAAAATGGAGADADADADAAAAAAEASPPSSAWVSTDDALTAHVWRCLCIMRCAQLEIAVGTGDDGASLSTTCFRAVNYRLRTDPKLPAGFCGNGVSQVATSMAVGDLAADASTTAVVTSSPTTSSTVVSGGGLAAAASRLRGDLSAHTPQRIAARARWVARQETRGASVKWAFDAHALTFIISSWRFSQFDVDFGGAAGAAAARPAGFDHGAHVPIVAVFAPGPEPGSINVYASGPLPSIELFARLASAGAGAGAGAGAAGAAEA